MKRLKETVGQTPSIKKIEDANIKRRRWKGYSPRTAKMKFKTWKMSQLNLYMKGEPTSKRAYQSGHTELFASSFTIWSSDDRAWDPDKAIFLKELVSSISQCIPNPCHLQPTINWWNHEIGRLQLIITAVTVISQKNNSSNCSRLINIKQNKHNASH